MSKELEMFGIEKSKIDEVIDDHSNMGGAKMLAMSCLSDMQEELLEEPVNEVHRQKINRIKYIISKI